MPNLTMEMEFDKEIDALLRSQKASINDVAASAHLDADEIAAFAAGAVSEFLRANYISHLADCGRCRFLFSEAAAYEEAPVLVTETVVEPARPGFFAKLFALPKLVYGMGALALVFAGLLGFTVLTSDRSTNSEVAVEKKVDTAAPAAAPESRSAPSAVANAAANSSSAAANTAANVAVEETPKTLRSPEFPKPEDKASGPNLGNRNQDALVDSKDDADVGKNSAPVELSGKVSDNAPAPGSSGGALAKPVIPEPEAKPVPPPAPVRSANETSLDGVTDSAVKEKSERDNPKAALKKQPDSDLKKVSGRSFQKKNGVWIDSTYNGGATVNIKRGTEDFEKLDSSVRSIANQLGGTVIVVSGGKAYKIQ